MRGKEGCGNPVVTEIKGARGWDRWARRRQSSVRVLLGAAAGLRIEERVCLGSVLVVVVVVVVDAVDFVCGERSLRCDGDGVVVERRLERTGRSSGQHGLLW